MMQDGDKFTVPASTTLEVIGGGSTSTDISIVGQALGQAGKDWATATDAASWTARQMHSALTYNNKLWVIAGNTGSYARDVWYSSDGASWTQATSTAQWSGRYDSAAVAFSTSTAGGEKMWVLGGRIGSTSYEDDVWYSTSGVSWIQATAAAGWSARMKHSAVVYDNKMWIMGGYNGSYLKDVWYSTTGVSWVQATSSANWEARQNAVALVYDGKMWIMGGWSVGGAYKNDVWYSTDGRNWTQATDTAVWAGRESATGVVYDNKMWIMGGMGGTFRDAWYSTDGKNWTKATDVAQWSARYEHASEVFNGKIWVIGGPSKNDVWYSPPLWNFACLGTCDVKESSWYGPNINGGNLTVLNTSLSGENVASGTLNVDWYLGIHVVDEDSTSSGNIGNATCTVYEASGSSTVWKHNGTDWGTASVSTSTLTQSGGNATGTTPQPNSAGAIRIREYKRTSTAITAYKYNLQVVASGFSGTYDYYANQGNKYIASTLSTDGDVDLSISENWQRSTIATINGAKDYDGLNQPPLHGSWYAGMTSDLQFSLSSPTLNLSLTQANGWTATGITILSATTTYPGGYNIKADMRGTQGKLATSTPALYEIARWNALNASPTSWSTNCPGNPTYCGFGYTTSDNNLYNASTSLYDNRFLNSTKYAGFATSSALADRVGDSTTTASGATTTITYKVSVDQNQPAANYVGTVYYICTVNY